MGTPMTPTERLLEAKRLIESVMHGLDTSIIDCSCPEHIRHFSNWSDAQTHIRLQAVADRLGREAHNDSVSNLNQREHRRQQEAEAFERLTGRKVSVEEYLHAVTRTAE